MRKLVIASSNPGKIREFSQMLGPLGFEIVPQAAFGIEDAEEPHPTFIENALAKARHASRASRMPAFADDSGICVAALGGAPGVHSARYAEGGTSPRDVQDERNNEKLLAALSGAADRSAHYSCVIVLVRHAEDPEPIVAEGRWAGDVIVERRGANGFGSDPYFLLPGLGVTAAELDVHATNAVSHRGKALQQLVARMAEEYP